MRRRSASPKGLIDEMCVECRVGVLGHHCPLAQACNGGRVHPPYSRLRTELARVTDMTKSLTVLREREEARRFERERVDDSRTAISAAAAIALSAALKSRLDGEVRFDKGARALYSTDGSNYRQAPIGVVIPRHIGDVEATVEMARRYGAPILSRGGGTSLAGQCCNVAVVMDFSKYMHRVLEVDAPRRLARVEPGCVLDELRNFAKRHHGLT